MECKDCKYRYMNLTGDCNHRCVVENMFEEASAYLCRMQKRHKSAKYFVIRVLHNDEMCKSINDYIKGVGGPWNLPKKWRMVLSCITFSFADNNRFCGSGSFFDPKYMMVTEPKKIRWFNGLFGGTK